MGKHCKPITSKLPYPVRLKKYHEEKDKLFYELKNLTPEEIQERQIELVRKWGI